MFPRRLSPSLVVVKSTHTFTALDKSITSDDVISDCWSESEESKVSFTVDYELEFEGSSGLVESNDIPIAMSEACAVETLANTEWFAAYEEERKKEDKKKL